MYNSYENADLAAHNSYRITLATDLDMCFYQYEGYIQDAQLQIDISAIDRGSDKFLLTVQTNLLNQKRML